MTQINAYLNFSGNCREAMSFYKESLGGELTIQSIGESPVAAQMPPEDSQDVLHSMLVSGGMVLMGSDMNAKGLSRGTDFMRSISADSEEEGKSLFEKLSSGGKVVDPFQMMFWDGMFGSLTDKFGFNWIVNHDPKGPVQ